MLDEEESFIDATFAMAQGGGAEISPTKRGKGMKIMAIVDRYGLLLSVTLRTCAATRTSRMIGRTLRIRSIAPGKPAKIAGLVSIPGAFSFPRSELNLILPNNSQEVGMFCLPSRLPRKTEDERERIKQEMAEAVAAYRGPIVKCPPGRAAGSSGRSEADLDLLTRPRFRASGGSKTG